MQLLSADLRLPLQKGTQASGEAAASTRGTDCEDTTEAEGYCCTHNQDPHNHEERLQLHEEANITATEGKTESNRERQLLLHKRAKAAADNCNWRQEIKRQLNAAREAVAADQLESCCN